MAASTASAGQARAARSAAGERASRAWQGLRQAKGLLLEWRRLSTTGTPAVAAHCQLIRACCALKEKRWGLPPKSSAEPGSGFLAAEEKHGPGALRESAEAAAGGAVRSGAKSEGKQLIALWQASRMRECVYWSATLSVRCRKSAISLSAVLGTATPLELII